MRERLKALIPSSFARFALCGAIAAAVNIASRIALSEVMRYEIAIVIAFLIAMTVGYLLMTLFVFDVSGKSVANEYLRFGLVNVVALGQVWLISVGLSDWFFPAAGFAWHPETVAHVIGVMSPVVTSYVAHKSFTFAPEKGRAA